MVSSGPDGKPVPPAACFWTGGTEEGRSGNRMRPANILIVEDHRLVRHVIARSLRNAGFLIMEADCAERARDIAETGEVDVAVLDISLPGEMNGIQLGRWLRARRATIPLVFVTGLTDWEIIDAIPDDPRSRFLRKPFGSRVIVDMVNSLLAPHYRVGAAQPA